MIVAELRETEAGFRTASKSRVIYGSAASGEQAASAQEREAKPVTNRPAANASAGVSMLHPNLKDEEVATPQNRRPPPKPRSFSV